MNRPRPSTVPAGVLPFARGMVDGGYAPTLADALRGLAQALQGGTRLEVTGP